MRQGYVVLYGDTDSLFVSSGLPADTSSSGVLDRGKRLGEQINRKLKSHVESEYGVVSRLDLEFEKAYSRFFLPPLRVAGVGETGARGRAKGYAGQVIAENGTGFIEVKGMEAVRRDWTDLAQEFQRELLFRVFAGRSPEDIRSYVDEVVKRLEAGDLDGKLVYRKVLRKKIEEYTKNRPPHAKAAALLPPEKQRGVIRYILTVDGPQPEELKTSAIDYHHYRERQLKPIAGSFAEVLGVELSFFFREDTQLRLF